MDDLSNNFSTMIFFIFCPFFAILGDFATKKMAKNEENEENPHSEINA